MTVACDSVACDSVACDNVACDNKVPPDPHLCERATGVSTVSP